MNPRYQRRHGGPYGLFMPRFRAYFVQFSARTSAHTGVSEVVCSKVSGQKNDANRSYDPEEKHSVNIDLAFHGPGSLTLHKLQHAFWVHTRSLCMHIDDGNGEISYSPMIMEFKMTNVRTENPKFLHLIRITSWPQYMNEALNLQGKFKKDSESGEWATYRPFGQCMPTGHSCGNTWKPL